MQLLQKLKLLTFAKGINYQNALNLKCLQVSNQKQNKKDVTGRNSFIMMNKIYQSI